MYNIANDGQTHDVIKKHPFVEEFMNNAHGSGIDWSWRASETKSNIRLNNAFHLMDDSGYYYAVAEFVVVISKKNPREFTINYTTPQSRYYGEKHYLKDLLYQTFDYALGEALKSERKSKKPVKKPAKRVAKRTSAWYFDPNSQVKGGTRPFYIVTGGDEQNKPEVKVIQMQETSTQKGIRSFKPGKF